MVFGRRKASSTCEITSFSQSSQSESFSFEKTITKTERIVIVADGNLKKNGKYALTNIAPIETEPTTTGTAALSGALEPRSDNIFGSVLDGGQFADYPSVMLSLPKSSSYPISSFIYGLAVGQISVIIVMLVFIRFFIFAGLPQDKRDYQSHIRQQRQAKLLPDEAATSNTILEKTYYDVDSHSSESLNWFTVLVAQAIAYLREDARQDDNLLHKISKALNSDKIPSYIDKINVTELNIGNDYPVFRNCRVISKPKKEAEECNGDSDGQHSEGSGLPHRNNDRTSHNFSKSKTSKDDSNNDLEDDEMMLEVLLDVDLSDCIALGLNTNLMLNYPRALFAYLPVSLNVSVKKFSGTLQIALRQPKPVDPNEDTQPSERPDTVPNQGKPAAAPKLSADETETLRGEGRRKAKNEGTSADSDDEEDEDNAISEEDDSREGQTHVANGSTKRAAAAHSADFPKPDEKNSKSRRPYMTLSFFEFPFVEFDIKSSIGSRSKLTNVSKISRLVEAQLKKAIERYLVYPNEHRIYLPSIWPESGSVVDKSKLSKNGTVTSHSHSVSGAYQPVFDGEDASSAFHVTGTDSDPMFSDGVVVSEIGEAMANGGHENGHYVHGTPRLHPRSFSSVSQLASNTATNLPNFRALSAENGEDHVAAI